MRSKSLHITFDLYMIKCFSFKSLPLMGTSQWLLLHEILCKKDDIKYKVERCLYLIISWTGWLTLVDMPMSHPDPPSRRTGFPSCWEGSWQIAFSCQTLKDCSDWRATSPEVMPLYWLFISNDELMPSWESLRGHFSSRGFPEMSPNCCWFCITIHAFSPPATPASFPLSSRCSSQGHSCNLNTKILSRVLFL